MGVGYTKVAFVMMSKLQAGDSSTPTATHRLAPVLWPAFLAAGLMEMLVFAFVSPSELHWGQAFRGLPPAGIYTLAFFAFWGVTSLSSWLTLALSVPRAQLNPHATQD